MEHSDAGLAAGEVLIFSTGADFGYGTVSLGETEWQVKEELLRCSVAKKARDIRVKGDYLIVFATPEERCLAAAVFGVGEEEKTFQISCTPKGEDAAVDAFVQAVQDPLAESAAYAGCGD